jgi:hypothetical protein
VKSNDIYRDIVPASGRPEVKWHKGQVESWNDETGSNSININGESVPDVSVLSTGAVQPFQDGDSVGILLVGSTPFILGKVREPGAGAAERIASNRVAASVTVPLGGAFADLAGSYGPEVNVYIGSSRKCLVIHSCEVTVTGAAVVGEQGSMFQAVQVTGESNIPVETGVTSAFLSGISGLWASVTATTFVTSANGLRQGMNRFTCKYKAFATASQGAQVNNRVLSVIPF